LATSASGRYHLVVVAEDGAVLSTPAARAMMSGPRRLGAAAVVDAGAAGGVCEIARQLVACGGFHTMAVTAAGHARTCGDYGRGPLGVSMVDRTDTL